MTALPYDDFSKAGECLHRLVEAHARRMPDSEALLAPGRATITYGALWQQMLKGASQLRSLGIEQRDRVAVALPDGPEMVVAVLTISSVAICAPLNPATSR